MADLTFLFSLTAIILSSASVILVIIRIGIGLGIEFVEKKEIREMKKKIDDALNEQWIARLRDFVKMYSEETETITEETTIKEIAELGEATRHTQIASTLLKVISKMIFDIVKLVVAVMASAILFIVIVWASVSYVEWQMNLWAWSAAVFVILVGFIFRARTMIRSYISLRSKFYELSENPSLSKATGISNEIEEQGLIYA